MSELLVKNGTVFSYIYEGYYAIRLLAADVHIEDGIITEVKPDIRPDCETLDASGCLVLPGIINMGASTFAARITSGLLWDWRAGKSRVAPMLDMAAEMMTAEEARAVSMLGLWETVSGGVTTVAELFRADGGVGPLHYRAAPEGLTAAMSRAADDLGVRLVATGEDKLPAGIVPESAVSCAHLGIPSEIPYDRVEHIRSGVKTTIGTGSFGNSMISEMRAAACAVKQTAGDAGAYRAGDVFYSVTVLNGGLLDAEKYGRVAPGFLGDLSVVCMDRFAPLSYPLAQYVYGANEGDVRHVVCGGNVLKRDCMPEGSLAASLPEAAKIAGSAISRLWENARRVIL